MPPMPCKSSRANSTSCVAGSNKGLLGTAGDSTRRQEQRRPNLPRRHDRPTVEGGRMPPKSRPRGGHHGPRRQPIEPLAAVSGHRQVFLIDTGHPNAPERPCVSGKGTYSPYYSCYGRSLLAAGGIGADSGKAILSNTKSWMRTASLGDELDDVLAADLSPDRTKLVLGGPSRLVKVLALPGGETLHTFRKPTDSGDRGRLQPRRIADRRRRSVRWPVSLETRSGKEFLTPPGAFQSRRRDRLDRPDGPACDRRRRRLDTALGPQHRQGRFSLGGSRRRRPG